MAANFPTSLPALKTDYSDNNDDVMAANQNQPNLELNAVAGKVGVNNSSETSSHDYIVNHPNEKLFNSLNAPQGFLINGKIVPSVASNNLTVAIKGLDGNDPSATNPVYCRIGDTIRSITSALSVTKNAGTNWFNAGASETAGKEIDYFVYLGYNTTDGVVLGYARICHATQYDDFSATTTNERYCAISTITNAAATDEYEVIGRFAAALSAGAGYTWNVPSFTTNTLVQKPIYETRMRIYTPTITGYSSNPTSATYRYQIRGFWMNIIIREGATGTSNATGKTYTAPMSTENVANTFYIGAAIVTNNGSIDTGDISIAENSNLMDVRDYDHNSFSGNCRINVCDIKFKI